MPTPAMSTIPVLEYAELTSGGTFWSTKTDVQGRRALLTDGPHGVRYQAGQADHMGIAASEPATCFPPAAGLGQSWNPELAERIGAALATEARQHGVGVLLGPGINIRRDPRGGRNFEYYSEDPLLSGVLGAAWVRGLQDGGVGASVKHFAANNCETDRMRSNSDVAPRPLREIYLRGFERVVKEAAPWTVMCSYNKINGVLASENKWLLTDVLRTDWGFNGVVVSDWGAVADRVAAVAAGLDLTMPGGDTSTADQQIVDAVLAGDLDAATVQQAADRVNTLIERVADGAATGTAPVDFEEHHALARLAAANSIVLLKNDGELLPLSSDARVAVIGPFATSLRFQGGGSSHVNPAHIDNPYDLISTRNTHTSFHPGLADDGGTDAMVEAARAAGCADVAVVFLGLSDSQESEGVDRENIDLPADQLALLREVVAAQPRTVVVLSHGGVIDLSEVDRLAPAILDGALLGQAGGSAITDVLFGDVNPSGKLTETVPLRLQDAPSYLNFPGEHSHVTYGEGIFVGYRGYDALDRAVAFPFGHGLSYTSFAYDDVITEQNSSGVTVFVDVTNTGTRAGREVVQFYVSKPSSHVQRAPRELKAFTSTTLEPGETTRVTVQIPRADLAYWDDRMDAWVVEDGDYVIWAAASSRDLRSSVTITVTGDDVRIPLSSTSTLGEILADPVAGPVLGQAMMSQFDQGDGGADDLGSDATNIIHAIPMDRLASITGGLVSFDAASLKLILNGAQSVDGEKNS